MRHSLVLSILASLGALAWAAYAAQPPGPPGPPFPRHPTAEQFEQMGRGYNARVETALAEPFKGITTNGEATPGLFPIHSTGVSTEPARKATEAFLASLDAAQRQRTRFPVDDVEWRKWANPHLYLRQGISLAEMNDAQRQAVFSLVQASLSADGLKLTRDIMRLNETLAELNDNDQVQYGEWKYWITVMGTPSPREPWGWQLEGHHLAINYFVLGDQVVMTPAFWGSEPTVATSGKYRGTSILQREQAAGLAMLRSLTAEQRREAVLDASPKLKDYNATEAFKDNVVLPYAGVRATTLSPAQKTRLLELISMYTGKQDDGHAKVQMIEVAKALDDTYFAWIGEDRDDSVFYYRIHSPVILVEFDHQLPVGLRDRYPRVPNREHVHVVVRTPNGNDYGKDLLRQHLAQEKH